MSTDATNENPITIETERLLQRFEESLDRLEAAKPFAKQNHLGRFIDQARRLLLAPDGVALAYEHAPRFDGAGVFMWSDYEHPETLKANLVPHTFACGESTLITLECLSELRFLSIVEGHYFHPHIAAEQAQHFLNKVLALNLHYLFGISSEASRSQHAGMGAALTQQLRFLAERIGYENILDAVAQEAWRITRQRPVNMDFVKLMIARMASCMNDPSLRPKQRSAAAEELVHAVYAPTETCREDPGIETYNARLQAMDASALEAEAVTLARSMHYTGLVSAYHAGFVRHLLEREPGLISTALGLSTTGRDSFLCYRDLVTTLLERCVFAETSQALLGMYGLLERAILYQPGVSNALWYQLKTWLSPETQERLSIVFGTMHPPHVYLLGGIISVLGHPLGVGQGNNPVCQSTRAISMWAYSDPDFLLQQARWAARDNNVVIMFEGQPLSSAALPDPSPGKWYFDLDPLSLVLVPHLDRIYMEMGRQVAVRGDDPHRWINPEFHGWRVHRGFSIVIDVPTGRLKNLREFVSMFYTLYHPLCNNNTPVVHPQPAGIAVTDSYARYVGWHAITILRVALDDVGVMRVYFFNPNNDSGQDWGDGVEVSTHGHHERAGESSLPIDQFTSRLYLFHYDPADYYGPSEALPVDEIERVVAMAKASWAADRA